MMQHPRAQRRRRRLPTQMRGAALVEAAVVIPVMLVFLGLIMFTHKSYEAKLDKQAGTRAAVLYYASHACSGEPPEGVVPQVTDDLDPGIPDLAGQTAKVGAAAQKLRPSEQAGLNRSHNLVRARPADTTIYGTTVNDRQTSVLKRSIHAESEVGCNEKIYGSNWTGVFGYAKNFIKSRGGFID